MSSASRTATGSTTQRAMSAAVCQRPTNATSAGEKQINDMRNASRNAAGSMASEFTFRIQRELHFRIRGVSSRGVLALGGLKQEASGGREGGWTCFWSLDNIHPKVGKIYGEDPLGALLNCINFLTTLIKEHEDLGWQIWWLQEGDRGGLGDMVSTKE
jgi:hypothetical protein